MLKYNMECPKCKQKFRSMPIEETIKTIGTLYSDGDASWGDCSDESFVISCPECDWSQEIKTVRTAFVYVNLDFYHDSAEQGG
jgi:hypothetical protein